MSNSSLKRNFALSAAFGRIPKTSKLEETFNQLKNEYEKLQEFSNSDKLEQFLQLESLVNSNEFQQRKNEINAQKYLGSEPQTKENRFKELKKSKQIKIYYQLKDSEQLKQYYQTHESEDLAKYEELAKFFDSGEFDEFKQSVKKEKADKEAEIKQQLAQYKELSSKYKAYYKFKNSKKLADFISFSESGLQEYEELKSIVESYNWSEIESRLQEEEKKLKESEEYSKQQELKKLEKSALVKNYNAILNSSIYADYRQLEGSSEIEEFESLKEFINSPEFADQKAQVKEIKFENTDKFKEFQEFKSLKASSNIKFYFKFNKSPKLAIYNDLNDSETITEYKELENYINSDEFNESKKYLLTKDKFSISEEYKDFEAFENLKKDEDIVWFQKVKDSNKFDWLKQWELTFEDNFDGNSIDQERWLTGNFWGKTLMDSNYSHVGDNQYYTDGKNIELQNSAAVINTRKENAKGKSWNPALGFQERDFDYTSGIINTGQSFRQKYGLFQAKVKVGNTLPVYHVFSLKSEKIVPEINIFKSNVKSLKKTDANYFTGNPLNNEEISKSINTIKGPDFSSDYYIYSLEWTENKLTWKINDKVVQELSDNIPQEEMYISLFSAIPTGTEPTNLPTNMEIDWVRVYQLKN